MAIVKIDSVVELLDAKDRHYKYSAYSTTDMQKIYNYVDTGLKLLSFAQDECGTVSDVFILYAIAMMGIVDEDGILLFLQNIKRRHPEFNIAHLESRKDLAARLRALQKFGYIYVIKNKCLHEHGGKAETIEWNFYFLTKDANELVCHKLSRRIPYNNWLMAAPFNKILEWTACSFIGSRICHHSNYEEYLSGYFQSKLLGKYFFPSEIKFHDGESDHYIAVLGSYLYRNDDRQTEGDFKRVKIDKINAIKNYLSVRAPRDGDEAGVIVVVDTIQDLAVMAEAIEKTRTLLEYLPNIYFTGEGILKNVNYFEDAFFTLEQDENGNLQCVKTVPEFLKKK